MNLKYTLCFLRSSECVAMMNRFRPPNMGLWNGIGGRIEDGETPAECVVREVWEETGYHIEPVFAGIVTWEHAQETGASGMYVYVADIPECEAQTWTAQREEEGIYAWLPIAWVMDECNMGVVSNIPHFLPQMLAGDTPMRYHCTYVDGYLHNVEMMECPKVKGV